MRFVSSGERIVMGVGLIDTQKQGMQVKIIHSLLIKNGWYLETGIFTGNHTDGTNSTERPKAEAIR